MLENLMFVVKLMSKENKEEISEQADKVTRKTKVVRSLAEQGRDSLVLITVLGVFCWCQCLLLLGSLKWFVVGVV